MRLPFLILLIFYAASLLGQTETTITGKVQDKHTKEVLPYVSIGLKGLGIGTTSDFEGRFKITTSSKVDSLLVTYVGYKRYAIKIKNGLTQNLLIELDEQSFDMNEVLIRPGVNPALRIIKAANKNRDINNQTNIDYYQYDSYSKTDVSLTNISDEMKNSKIFKPLASLFDTLHQMRNDEGKHILPIFVSEVYSKYYYSKEANKSKEVIEGSNYQGIGVGENSYLTDLMGGQLHHLNFNLNYIRLLNKDFISPIGDAANFYYVFTLLDSMDIDGFKCYKIQVNLKRKQDLGFEGMIWIADESFALKRINLAISKASNINFLNKVTIQQELVPAKKNGWITSKSRILFDFDRIAKNRSGMVAGFYNAYTHIDTYTPIDQAFFDLPVTVLDGSSKKDSTYWEDKRTEPLSSIEKEMFFKVDSVNKLPMVMTYIDIARIIVEGYKRIDKVDWGPYVFLIGGNQVEGLRLRLGFKTNAAFSNRFIYKGYLAYGFKDEKFKYSAGMDYIMDRKKWTIASIKYRNDYDILGITNSVISAAMSNNLFQVANFFSGNIRINKTEEINLSISRAFANNWTTKIQFDNKTFTPLGGFNFAYVTNPENGTGSTQLSNHFTTSQIGIEARYAYKELMIARGNDRMRIEKSKLPVCTFIYQHGFKGVLNGNFNYNRIGVIVADHMNTGIFGTSDWYVYTGKIMGAVPYPLLDVARGNESYIYNDFNYSLMNFYEFVSDAYIHLSYTQRFEGFIFNKIPYINTLKLRNLVFVKSAYGSLSDANKLLSSPTDIKGKNCVVPHSFGSEPYLEMGYGIDNIFKFMSLNFTHRLNYLNLPNARKFGVNIGFRVQF